MTLTEATTGLRIVPAALVDARRPQRMIERSLMVNRHTWLIIVTGFFEPLFYLLSIRVGFGSLVGDVQYAGQSIPYAEFVAPALMAASAMNGAVYETTMNVFHKLKHDQLYDTVLATPMMPADVALGEIGWAVIRGFAVLDDVPADDVGARHGRLAVDRARPAGLRADRHSRSAPVGMALTTYMRSWADFEYVAAVTLPLFLFSATFYPLSSYGELGLGRPAEPAVPRRRASCATSTSARWEWSILVHLGVLLALSVAGLVVASRRIGRCCSREHRRVSCGEASQHTLRYDETLGWTTAETRDNSE